ncbi:MAG: CBS domain-containing protein [Planctomycetota bacterium]
MIILYWMTPDPVVVEHTASLLDAVGLMQRHGVRRLPVVTGGDQLCGIVSRNDAMRHVGRLDFTQPVGPELERALSVVAVTDAMTPNPATCDSHDYVESVCERMGREKVGAYPVLRRDHLVGIVSETDLLRALAELAYASRPGRRITLRFPADIDHEYVYRVVSLCRRFRLHLQAILTHPILDEQALMMTLRLSGEQVDELVALLRTQGYKVVDD